MSATLEGSFGGAEAVGSSQTGAYGCYIPCSTVAQPRRLTQPTAGFGCAGVHREPSRTGSRHRRRRGASRNGRFCTLDYPLRAFTEPVFWDEGVLKPVDPVWRNIRHAAADGCVSDVIGRPSDVRSTTSSVGGTLASLNA